MLKLLLKIWPAFIPIMVYIFWIYVVEGVILKKLLKKEEIIEGEKIVGEKPGKKPGKFSLKNPCFVIILYMSLALAILILIAMAFS
ncbi:MAG: hypothetical protein V4694_03005 [Pseudomonadota bacterium]